MDPVGGNKHEGHIWIRKVGDDSIPHYVYVLGALEQTQHSDQNNQPSESPMSPIA